MKLFFRVLIAGVLLVALALGALNWYSEQPLVLDRPVVEFDLPLGTSMRQAATRISDAGVQVNPYLLVLLARLTRKTTTIKAGSYEVSGGLTPWQLILKLTRGDVTQGELALIEGWNFRQLRAALDANPDLRHDTAGLGDAEILSSLGATESHPEGLFFPDTYLFDRQASDLHLLTRAYRAMQKHLAEVWRERAPDLPLASPYEALIVASLVEKESARREDRELIASVLLNRLSAGMRLQTDPSVIYGLGVAFDGNLRKRDLLADAPYNTYMRSGLPPTPIAMPGLEALRAVAQAPHTEYLYFVARGDGSSEFSRTLEEHNRAVARFQKRSTE